VTPRLLEAFPEGATVVDRLSAVGWHVAVAESCTGGLLGAAITAVPGASVCFRGGIIAYDDGVKVELLGVPKELLREHGAVSAEVAAAMARGVRQRLATEVGLAVTGIAGPSGGTPAKPVGLIWVAALGPDGPPLLERLADDRGREGNRAAAVATALRLCLAVLGSE
jgi:PncC family amidohydrolase